MVTRRTPLKRRRGFDDYRWAELLTGEPPLLSTEGYFTHGEPGQRCVDQRDFKAMRRDWEMHREELIAEWIGEIERRQAKPWIFPMLGGPGTRPWAWWEFDAPEPIGDEEDEAEYLRRLGLMRPGEEERISDGTHDHDAHATS